MKKALSFVFAMLLTQSVMAKDILVSTATSDVDSVVAKLWLVTTDDGTATGLRLTTNDGSAPELYSPSKVARGIVLKQVDDYEVVVIKSDDFEVDRGGHLKLEFLSNGITGSRNDKDLEIEFDGRDWKLYHEGRQVNSFHFKGHKILGKLVGIKDVTIR